MTLFLTYLGTAVGCFVAGALLRDKVVGYLEHIGNAVRGK